MVTFEKFMTVLAQTSFYPTLPNKLLKKKKNFNLITKRGVGDSFSIFGQTCFAALHSSCLTNSSPSPRYHQLTPQIVFIFQFIITLSFCYYNAFCKDFSWCWAKQNQIERKTHENLNFVYQFIG